MNQEIRERIDQGFLRRECKRESDREQAEEAYNVIYERIAAQMIAEAVAEGMSEHWQPQFRHVHEKVLQEMESCANRNEP